MTWDRQMRVILYLDLAFRPNIGCTRESRRSPDETYCNLFMCVQKNDSCVKRRKSTVKTQNHVSYLEKAHVYVGHTQVVYLALFLAVVLTDR